MARYRGTLKGQRKETSRLGSPKSGLVASLNGWDFGVRVTLSPDPATGEDRATIYLTNGSNGGSMPQLREIGTFDAHGLGVT